MILLTLAATAVPPTASLDVTSLVQYGVLGVILVLVLFGFLWAKPSVERIIADKERAEQQRDELIKVYQEQVIPVLQDVSTRLLPALLEVQVELKAAREQRKGE